MLTVETRDGICRLTMNRPERRNALGTESMALLLAALQAADIDKEVRVIVLTAAAPAFCAGSDLKELGGLNPEEMYRHEAATAAVVRYFAAMDKPIIAAVEGYALGGGSALAAACDVVVTSASTRWHMPEVSNGWLPPWGLKALIARTGPHRARSLCWGLEALNGEQAVSIGLADVMCEPGHAEDMALTLAHKFVALPAESVASCKRFYDPFLNADAEYLDRLASGYFASDCQGERAKTVLAKFGEKK